MNFKELTADISVEWAGPNLEITGLKTHSAECVPGDLFFAVRGERLDGNLYAEEAVKNGAVMVISEFDLPNLPCGRVADVRLAMSKMAAKFYGEAHKSLKMIAVVGTNGKTTTAHMLSEILNHAGKPTALIGTLGVRFHDYREQATLTTPDPLELHRILRDLKEKGAEYVVMEVSAHAIHFQKVAPIRFDLGIFTNFSQDHLDFFYDMERYGRVKQSFFRSEQVRFSLLNADDALGQKILRENLIFSATYGIKNPCDVFAVDADYRQGTRAIINCYDEIFEINSKFTGEFNLYNTLAAIGASRALSVSQGDIVSAFESMNPPEGRFYLMNSEGRSNKRVLIDFAHTPDGLENLLKAARKITEGKVIAVFGCGGNRDATKRSVMGRIAGEWADFVILTSDNNRDEEPEAIMSEIEKGLRPMTEKYLKIADREHAIYYAVNLAGKDDLVVLAGKGAETYMEEKGIKRPYSDKQVVLDVFGRYCV